MFEKPRFAALLVTGALASTSVAQVVGPGLSWQGSTSNASVGSFSPECRVLSTTTARGESVTIVVWGDLGARYGLFVSPGTMGCVPFRGINGGLLLALPIPLVAGVLTERSPCLACPPGRERIPLTVPTGLPSGASASFQALSFGGGAPGFTVAITATVR